VSARPLFRTCLAAVLLLGAGHAIAQQTLQIGTPQAVVLPGVSLTNSVHLDVPAGAERLELRYEAAASGRNLVMMVRFGSPFIGVELDRLLAQSHYFSFSAGGEESIVISRAGHQPLRGGRWYFSLVNLSDEETSATLRASLGAADAFVPIRIVFDDTRQGCDVSGWNDNSSRQAEGGNSGTTLGQQRRLAVLEAARIMSEELRPNAEIRVQACWSDLDDGVLAQAGPRGGYFVNDPGIGVEYGLFAVAPYLAARHIVQVAAPAIHQAGTASCRLTVDDCQNPLADARATFNSKIDAQANENRRFDYGFVHSGSTSKPSFLSVAMHEIGHGIGFLGLTSKTTGVQPAFLGSGPRYDDAYGHHARFVTGGTDREFLRLSNEERVQAMTSSDNLRFAGERSVGHPQNPYLNFALPTSMVRLHSPPTISAGSTYSHLSGTNHLVAPQLMSAQIHASAPRSLGLGVGLFEDIGFFNTASAVPAPAGVLQSQYLDPARNGHGFEIRRITGIPGVDNLYFVIFYSYEANGRPEFFNSVGEIVDGVFLPARDQHGNSLVRPQYVGPGQTESDPAFEGELRIDFVDATRHPACHDGAAGRALDGSTAIMSWTVQGVQRQWCVQPLVAGREGVEIDFSNQWWDPSDGGWGLSVLSFPGAGGDGLGLQLYFPDANGRGRWALVQTASYVPGAELPVLYPTAGYCRTCTMPGAQQFEQIGTMSIDLRAPGEGASTISFDVTWPGPEGGRFVREDAQIEPVGTPNYR
jgi:hypothetical protein